MVPTGEAPKGITNGGKATVADLTVEADS